MKFSDVIDQIISNALKIKNEGAEIPSDIIIKTSAPPYAIVHNNVVKLQDEVNIPSLVELKYLLNERQLEILEKHGSVSFSYIHFLTNLRCRVQIYMERGNLACVIRLIPKSINTIEELNLPKSLIRFTELDKGLVLITGPTGSGKTTTMAALIDRINKLHSKHIVILEDTIEFIHQNQNSVITYREIFQDSPDYCQALKDVLRMRAHVVVVGEVRTSEEMDVVLSLAESGHLVFAAIHAGAGVNYAIERVVSMFATEYQDFIRYRLSNSLEGIVSIRLLPVTNEYGQTKTFPVCEVMFATPPIRKAIREKKSVLEYMTPEEGMQTFEVALREFGVGK
jgi:twitching motility protein PilT